jgi:hypothetical protein
MVDNKGGRDTAKQFCSLKIFYTRGEQEMGVHRGEMGVLKVALYFLSLAREVLIISVAHCTPFFKGSSLLC